MIMGDWNSVNYITGQIFTVIGYILLAITYFITGRHRQLYIIILSNLSIGIGFLLLGGYVGVGMCLVAILRDTVSNIIHDNRRAKNRILRADWYWLTFWIFLFTIATVLTASDFNSLFAYFATVIFTISIWQKNLLIDRLLGMLSAIFFIIYNICLQSFMGTILESVLLVSIAIGIILGIRNKKIFSKKILKS